jgi:integrase
MLTDTEIRKAKPGPKPRKLTDARGLFLLLTPAGGRWWRLKYRFAGKEKLLSLGVYPDVPLKAAREKAEDVRRQVAAGTDPSAARQAEKRAVREAAENDFESVAREWLENVKGQWAPQHHADSLKRFEVRIFPRIGHRPIRDITTPELLSALRAIEARGTIESTHKVARACGQVFRFAIAAGRCDHNPAADLRGALKAKPKAKPMAALAASDLPGLLAGIDSYDGDVQTRLALKLLALTFVRTNELRSVAWTEIDLDKAEWTIPAERMKTKAPHHVPLARQAVEAFRQLKALNGARMLAFPGRRPTQPISKNTILFALYRMGYHSRMTAHGFRAIASTTLNELGFRPDVIERQLAHTEKNAVRAAYHRSQYLEERMAMMQQWADHLDALRASGGKVIAIGQGRKGAADQLRTSLKAKP